MTLTGKLQKYQHYEIVKIDKFEYFTGKKILPSCQSTVEKAKFTYSSSGKYLEKQIKTIADQGKKQVEVLKSLKPIGNRQKPESIEGVFQEIQKTLKLKVN